MFEEARSFEDQEAAGSWLAGTFGAWADTLPAEEHEALAAYKGDEYRPLNAALRRGRLQGHQLNRVAALDRALERFALPEAVVAYRGFHLAGRPVLGAEIQDLAYLSTSLLRRHAQGFLTIPAEQPFRPAIARVLLPVGVRCGAPDLIEYLGEVEILLPRRSRLRIRAAASPSRERPHWTVDLEAIL